MTAFNIEFLDHVAIKAADVQISAAWYEKALGLKRFSPPEWGAYPVFMFAGKTGVAIFPAKGDGAEAKQNIRIDHFAFNVDQENFEKAKQHYKEIGIEFALQDHVYYHSIYTRDPDGHVVELTTQVLEISL